jgi:hypothetical protein
VLKHVVEMLGSPAVFGLVTWILVKETQFALPFLGR